MTVLETFIHDPLVEWTKTSKSSGGEVRNPQAQVLSVSCTYTVALLNKPCRSSDPTSRF
jgi:phosphatidylinositol kinase/protein kinase (PI-3  family)